MNRVGNVSERDWTRFDNRRDQGYHDVEEKLLVMIRQFQPCLAVVSGDSVGFVDASQDT